MAYGCNQCVGKLKPHFAEKYGGEFLCRLEGSAVNCHPETDIEQGNLVGEGLGLLGILGTTKLNYRCRVTGKEYAVPACAFGGHPHWSALAAMEMENDSLRTTGRPAFTGEAHTLRFLRTIKDLVESDGFEAVSVEEGGRSG